MKDCKNCSNCDRVWGFMCTCHYSYVETNIYGKGHYVQVGQDVNRKRANKCDYYTEHRDSERLIIF